MDWSESPHFQREYMYIVIALSFLSIIFAYNGIRLYRFSQHFKGSQCNKRHYFYTGGTTFVLSAIFGIMAFVTYLGLP